ncbi:Protein of unknown function, DUF [Marinomonas aquimarina]|uniref:Metal-binding protein n=1 Tax=Marinomonas aquimarina TaxID=295068 RepID=A0A1A8TGL2_9GAMM|nr:DUF411 domain-containing protein [Marinomonas aquimarina]SBS31392.1 Protein of unknown function, DUF [Marinomonas aquimarina]
MNKLFSSIMAISLLTATAIPTITEAASETSIVRKDNVIEVHKSPTCGCCNGWLKHMEDSGFNTHINHPQNLTALKNEMGVPANARSCHTAISKQGYIFEGHIPAKLIKQFLDNPPANTKGLVVPAMPVGSPGMEYNNQFMPYSVLLLNDDGTVSPYAEISTQEEQY